MNNILNLLNRSCGLHVLHLGNLNPTPFLRGVL